VDIENTRIKMHAAMEKAARVPTMHYEVTA
jgi:hypothetical protein